MKKMKMRKITKVVVHQHQLLPHYQEEWTLPLDHQPEVILHFKK
jgi:hypothetical protein